MNSDFWHERWQRGETGWHIDDVNPSLERYWPKLAVGSEEKVFVPLCGKSRDLLWLADQGHQVIGVELSAIGVEAFFAENGLIPRRTEDPPFRRYRCDAIEILCGDFFDLEPHHLDEIGAVYDRAALIALPGDLRQRYMAHLDALVPDAEMLLITVDYPQEEMNGPPFSVDTAEVESLWGASRDIMMLGVRDVLDSRFRERGLTELRERVFALKPRSEGSEVRRCAMTDLLIRTPSGGAVSFP